MVQFKLARVNGDYPTIEKGTPMRVLIDMFNISMKQRNINSYDDLTDEERSVISREDFEIYCE